MRIQSAALAGTMESGDIMVSIEPNPGSGIIIELKSTVEHQFGAHIRGLLKKVLADLGVENAKVSANDKGALDCTIIARLQTAVYRAAGMNYANWECADNEKA